MHPPTERGRKSCRHAQQIALMVVASAISSSMMLPALALADDAMWESMFVEGVTEAALREALLKITSYDHVAGTVGDLRSANFVRDKLKASFRDTPALVEVEPVDVMLSYPISRQLTMTEPQPFTASLSETILPNDVTSDNVWRNLSFNAYSASGNVSAELVYANYGDPDDFVALENHGVSVEGKVVIVRYGSTFRGLKVSAS
eukprot:768452-Hanusia_phi.AAC.6